MESNGYIRSLDGVRALGILLVMSFHAELTHFGWMGVQLFFVLSGFLITGILWRDKFNEEPLSYKFKKFWVRRSLRIFPLYFGYLLFLGLTYLFFHFPSYYTTYIPYLLTYTFNFTRTLPEWQGNPLFTHLWSLSIEEQFYLLFPLIILLCPPKFTRSFMILVIIITPVTRYFLGAYYSARGFEPEITGDIIYWNTFSHLDAFFMGGIIPVLSLGKTIKKPKLLFLATLTITILAGIWNFTSTGSVNNYLRDLGFNHGQISNYEHVWYYTCLNLFFASFILILVSIHSQHQFKVLKSILNSGWMVRIGKVSYSMYVLHWLILVYVFNGIFKPETTLYKALLFIPYVITVYLVAEVSYKLYEAPFVKLKDRFFPAKEHTIPVKPATKLVINDKPL